MTRLQRGTQRVGRTGLKQIGARLAVRPRVRQVQLPDDTGRWSTDPTYPDGDSADLSHKAAWVDRPEYDTSVRSYDVYRSVLDDGVRTPQQFHQWSVRTRSS